MNVCLLGLYRTSRPVRNSGIFSKSGLSEKLDILLPGCQTFHTSKNRKKCQIFFSNFFGCLFGLEAIPDSVPSCRISQANLDVWACPARKLICPVWSSPTVYETVLSCKICKTATNKNLAVSN